MRLLLTGALIGLVACETQYESQIGAVPGPDTVAEPDPAAQARWRTTRLEGLDLRAVACAPDGAGAVAVGRDAAVVRIGDDGRATPAPAGPGDLAAVLATPAGLLAAGPGGLYECRPEALTPDGCRRVALPRAGALPRALATSAGDTVWVAGRAPRGATTVGWVARRRAGTWTERLVEDVPAVNQVFPQGDGAVLVIESTPYVWTPSAGASGGALAYYMPAQPDAHPPIAALARTPRGFVAVGPDNAWRLEHKTLVRELRQLYLRLEAVAALPDGRAVAVGRDDPPGGRAGGLALGRDAQGRWRRELLVPGAGLHGVAHCGTHTIAVGEEGVVAVRRD